MFYQHFYPHILRQTLVYSLSVFCHNLMLWLLVTERKRSKIKGKSIKQIWKILTTEKNWCNYPKIWTVWLDHTVTRAATIHSTHDTIRIAILASRYNTYRDTLFRVEIISNCMRIILWCSPYFKVCLKWFTARVLISSKFVKVHNGKRLFLFFSEQKLI